ncbi:hypothetical protein ABFS82_13G100500 [Erythranthe guttata]
MERRRRIAADGRNRGMEENTLAILDTSGFNNSKFSPHLNDDRLAFLEAVRTASLLPDNGSAPTGKMFEAIFHILKDVDSLDLMMESYQLLIELDKCFPRVYLSKGECLDSSLPSEVLYELIIVEEAWIPFNFRLDGYNEKREAANHSSISVDALGFHALIQDIDRMAKEMKSEEVKASVETNFLKNMLLLQYLITVLEGDFLPRNCTYQETMNWTILRESQLNLLLGSRKIIYKGLMKDCLSIMCDMSQLSVFSEEDGSTGELLHGITSVTTLALPEMKKSTCNLLKKLLLMIMELDSSRRVADQQGHTTRADGVRTPAMEIILDELMYNNDILPSFLQVFDPRWKLEIIVQYFQKYIPKYSVQTRRSSGAVKTENFDGVLKCLSNSNITKSIVKKISSEVVQLLLAYAFQAYLALFYQHVSGGVSVTVEHVKSNSLHEICKNLVSAFTSLRKEDPDTEMLCCSKEALFTAAAILSAKM